MPVAAQSPPLLEGKDPKPGKREPTKLFLRYILFVATLAFTGRAAPLAFMPLVLKESFDQPSSVIGIVMAIYPFFALVTTPFASRLSRNSSRIVTLHSWAIIAVAFAMFLTSAAEVVRDHFGNTAGVAWVALGRAVQGFGASLYLSSNTCLITRKFPDRLPYVIAMTEVAVGSGSQLGRLCGGFLYDFGGFPAPFVAIGLLQGFVGIVGFGFEDGPLEGADKASAEKNTSMGSNDGARKQRKEKIPWRELATPRLCVGALAAFMMYFVGCFGDATLLQYLVVHLAPVTVGTLSVGMSSRGMTYLLTSFFIAQMMHGELISFERLISCGALFGIIGQIIMGPQPFVTSFQTWLSGSTPPMWVLWSTEILSFVFAQMGGALMFVPSLPLMQSEVKVHGDEAVEQVAELFVTMMTLGEMVGPIFGGWLVGWIGFLNGSLILAMTLLPLFLLTLATYDRQARRARRGMRKQHDLVAPVLDPGQDDSFCGGPCGAGCVPFVPSDGEASFAWRRLPFAIEAQRELGDAPTSAPSSVFRRPYGEQGASADASRRYMSVPSENFRRAYVPPGPGP